MTIGNNTFHVYTKGTEGPTLVLLHGGGYSALTWAEFTVGIAFEMYQIENNLHVSHVSEINHDYDSL